MLKWSYKQSFHFWYKFSYTTGQWHFVLLYSAEMGHIMIRRHVRCVIFRNMDGVTKRNSSLTACFRSSIVSYRCFATWPFTNPQRDAPYFNKKSFSVLTHMLQEVDHECPERFHACQGSSMLRGHVYKIRCVFWGGWPLKMEAIYL